MAVRDGSAGQLAEAVVDYSDMPAPEPTGTAEFVQGLRRRMSEMSALDKDGMPAAGPEGQLAFWSQQALRRQQLFHAVPGLEKLWNTQPAYSSLSVLEWKRVRGQFLHQLMSHPLRPSEVALLKRHVDALG